MNIIRKIVSVARILNSGGIVKKPIIKKPAVVAVAEDSIVIEFIKRSRHTGKRSFSRSNAQ